LEKNIENYVNISFNVLCEPVICAPADAFKCFMGNEMELLAIEAMCSLESSRTERLKKVIRERYELD
jgi:carbamoyltransferase